ncbi:MAG TPA: FHA domain-containing protein, partial [Pyrinomonadaceae bacterium]|nr:FHA domain-containing protein [Pyrinomonadaceae bacterium]
MSDLRLKFVDQDGIDRSVAVETDEFVLGRQPGVDLVLPFPGVSREHAMIERSGLEFFIRDLGSSFGTKVNGMPVEGLKTLHNGDEIDVGDSVVLEVEIMTSAALTEEPKPEAPEALAESASAAPIASTPAASSPAPAPAAATGGSNMIWLAVLAPLTAVFLLAFIGGGLYLWNTSGQT